MSRKVRLTDKDIFLVHKYVDEAIVATKYPTVMKVLVSMGLDREQVRYLVRKGILHTYGLRFKLKNGSQDMIGYYATIVPEAIIEWEQAEIERQKLQAQLVQEQAEALAKQQALNDKMYKENEENRELLSQESERA